MSFGSLNDHIAGLDAMVLHFNTPTSSTSALEGTSCVSVQRPTHKRNSKRSSSPLVPRLPIQNKLSSQTHTPLHRTPSPSKLSFSIHHDSVLASTSFHPLPPLPSASSLQLPSFLDTPLTSLAPLSPSTVHSPNVHRLSPPAAAIHDQSHIRSPSDEPYWFPTLQHPNSPYVPWTSPIRRQFLRPSTPSSVASSVRGRYLQPFTRPETQALEPQQSPVSELEIVGSKDVKRLQQLHYSLKRGMGRVTKWLVRLPIFSKSSNTNPRLVHSQSTPTITRIQPEPLSTDNMHRSFPRPPRPFAGSPILRSPSRCSMLSTETNSLAVWLAARHRENTMDTEEQLLMMTLEEYELMGSWVDLSRKAKGCEAEWDCGVRGCDLHSTPDTVVTSTDVEGAILFKGLETGRACASP